MTLSSVSNGFVLLRDLWEYNSILKYRYKKLKSYRVARMKHLPAPLTKEYKPNVAVRVFKVIYNNQKLVWSTIFSHFKDGLQGAGSLFSGRSKEPRTASSIIRNYKEKYPEKYERLMNIEVDNTRKRYMQSRQIQQPLGNGGLESYSTLPKQEVRERKLTHVRYMGGKYGGYFTQGKVYKVRDVRKYDDGDIYFDFECDTLKHIHTRLLINGKMVTSVEEDDFELIYNNEI